MADPLPRLYTDLAGWFHLLTRPDEYVDEAAAYRDALILASATRPRTLLELGSGGGNNAFHLKRDFTCTLSDLSPAMLALSASINPECEHVAGDMRTLRLGRTFDAVFVHDAVMYLLREEDLRQAVETAFVHCRPGGAAVFAPDYFKETFQESSEHGGHDGADGRALRYLEWTWDPDPADTTFVADFAYLLRERGEVQLLHDRHECGVFARATWIGLLQQAGFEVASATRPAGEGYDDEIFVARRPVSLAASLR